MPHRFSAVLRRAALLLLPAALLLAPAPAAAENEPISVTIDRAKVMRISRPANIVIIGNPAIADATIQDSQTLIITGRSFGTTNIIVLDSGGQAIADATLSVTAANDDVVTLYKRSARETLSCTPDCSPTLAIGDTGDSFEALSGQIEAHGEMSNAASGN